MIFRELGDFFKEKIHFPAWTFFSLSKMSFRELGDFFNGKIPFIRFLPEKQILSKMGFRELGEILKETIPFIRSQAEIFYTR